MEEAIKLLEQEVLRCMDKLAVNRLADLVSAGSHPLTPQEVDDLTNRVEECRRAIKLLKNAH